MKTIILAFVLFGTPLAARAEFFCYNPQTAISNCLPNKQQCETRRRGYGTRKAVCKPRERAFCMIVVNWQEMSVQPFCFTDPEICQANVTTMRPLPFLLIVDCMDLDLPHTLTGLQRTSEKYNLSIK